MKPKTKVLIAGLLSTGVALVFIFQNCSPSKFQNSSEMRSVASDSTATNGNSSGSSEDPANPSATNPTDPTGLTAEQKALLLIL